MLRDLFSTMAKQTIKDVNLSGQHVFVRVDYNVPMEETDGAMVINDDTRIKATLPTLDHLVAQGAKIILAAHLGPIGINGATAMLGLERIAHRQIIQLRGPERQRLVWTFVPVRPLGPRSPHGCFLI